MSCGSRRNDVLRSLTYLPAVHTPIGTFGSYWTGLLGLPENPVPNAAGETAHAKVRQSATKATSTYAKEVARLPRGVCSKRSQSLSPHGANGAASRWNEARAKFPCGPIAWTLYVPGASPGIVT